MSAVRPIHRNTIIASLLAFAALVLALSHPNQPARAAYPDRIIRIVVALAPGGGTDAIARALTQEMAKDLGGSAIIETGREPERSSEPRLSRPASQTATRC
jgi:hypothetical protein